MVRLRRRVARAEIGVIRDGPGVALLCLYLRSLQPEEYALDLCRWLREQGYDWDAQVVRASAPLVQEKIERFDQYPDMCRFLFEDVSPDGADPRVCAAARDRLSTLDEWEASRIEDALRALADELGEKPRNAFGPIRLAVTGAKVAVDSLFWAASPTSCARGGAVRVMYCCSPNS